MAVLFTTATIVTFITVCSGLNINFAGEASRKFAAKLYQEVSREGGDVLVSPSSIQQVLGLLQLGAYNETAKELANAICFPLNWIDLLQYLHAIPSTLLSGTEVEVNLTSAIFTRSDVRVDPRYLIDAEKINASIKHLLPNPDDAVVDVNNWFNRSTNGLLGDVLKNGDISIDTALLLVNALYFKGRWLDASFMERDTEPAKFYRLNENTVSVNMMRCNDNFDVGRDRVLNATYLQLDYVGNEFSLIIVLPDELDGLQRLRENIEHVLMSPPQLHPEQVDIRIPRFKASASIKLKSVLQRLGVKEAFGNAQLTGLTEDGKPLALSDVLHNTLLEVNEKGTEAAAASAAGIIDRIFSPPIPFYADHPFLYYLQHKLTGIILFIGDYSGGH